MLNTSESDKLRELATHDPELQSALADLLEKHRLDIRTITHEIRNPLTLVYSTLQLIEAAHPEVHTFRHWESLHNDILYMVQLLSELSAYNNSTTLSVSAINTGTFLKQIALSFAAHLEHSSIEFTSRIQADLPTLYGDSVRLKEVLLNLLKNASEAFSSDSHGQILLNASAKQHTGTGSLPVWCLYIQIQDTGCGIPAEQIDSVFRPFVTYKSGGTGLGLPVSRRIIEAHHGTLTLESIPSAGTTVTVILPFSLPTDN